MQKEILTKAAMVIARKESQWPLITVAFLISRGRLFFISALNFKCHSLTFMQKEGVKKIKY